MERALSRIHEKSGGGARPRALDLFCGAGGATRGIGAGETHVWQIPFFAGATSELGLLGDGTANIDLAVTGADDTPICLDTAPGDRALCALRLAENATLTITVTNRSETAATYSLLTN